MTYIKCVGIFFLIYSSIVAMDWLKKLPANKKISDAEKLLLFLAGWATGGLWFFLLLKLI